MSEQPAVLLLIGSAKAKGQSTSEALGRYLCGRMVDRGWSLHVQYVHQALRTQERANALLAAVDKAHLVVLAAPLYVDSLPYLVTDAMERIAAHRSKGKSEPHPTRFMSIINCGFPEATHNDVAIAICERFACAAGLDWAGALSLGGGGFVHGESPDELGPMAKRIVAALDSTAVELAAGECVPKEAAIQMAKPAIPSWIYTTVGNWGWRRTSRKLGVHGRLWDRPYTE